MPKLALNPPCGSRSTRKPADPPPASAAPRLTVVAVLPTPPFWLATTMTRPTRRQYSAAPAARQTAHRKRRGGQALAGVDGASVAQPPLGCGVWIRPFGRAQGGSPPREYEALSPAR